MLLNCGIGWYSWESLGLKGDPTSPSWRKSVLNIHWKDWCWSWSSITLATWCEELPHLKRPWRWERLKTGGDGDDRGWDGWMASLTQWTWISTSSESWWWTGRPGMLQSTGLQRVRHGWATELNSRLSFSHKKDVLTRATVSMNLEDIMLRGTNQSRRNKYFMKLKASRWVKFRRAQSKMVVIRERKEMGSVWWA